jgi:cardiolipin synthase
VFWIIIVLLLFIFQIVTIIFAEYRHPSKTVAWLIILFIFPLVGFVMYYFMAQTYTQKRKSKRKGQLMKEIRYDLQKRSQQLDPDDLPLQGELKHQRLFELLHQLPSSAISKYNTVTVYSETIEMFNALKAANMNARDHIHFQFYTIRDDKIGREFQQLLIRKALEGVSIRILYDGIGSYNLSKAYIKELS